MKRNKRNLSRKIISIVLSVVMLAGMLPKDAFASERNMVYISASDNGQFITDKNSKHVAHRGVSLDDLAMIDLDSYGLGDFKYDADSDGIYEITALHLYIYTHENMMGGNWDEVTISGAPGSIYFAGGLFGYSDENLRYDYNGAYPKNADGWGITADQLVLSAGDFLDVAHYDSWSFYMDTANGFHYFLDANGEITHEYEVKEKEELVLNLARATTDFATYESVMLAEEGYKVYYGKTIGNATGTVKTDENGNVSITFPTSGTYYVWCDGGVGVDNAVDEIVSSPASAKITVNKAAAEEIPDDNTGHDGQDVSAILTATMTQLAETVTEPAFGTNAGEWTVLSLARGEYYAKENVYFSDYYDRIVETVNKTAANVNLNGALHKKKSTDNSRLILALSSIGKDATAVGEWNLITPYDDFNWIKNQGINGVIFSLIALDTNNYQTTDTSIRQQCVDYLLEKQLNDGGWALSGTVADPDITGMTLQSLYNYRNQSEVLAAAEEGFMCLSEIQNANGTYSSGGDETSESCAQVIVACTTWGINPDTDSRFIKNGNSVIDALLAHYVSDRAAFKHVAGGDVNGMATDQACYALVAYDRFMHGKTALYDMSDVTEEREEPSEANGIQATLGLPEKVENVPGTAFHGVINVNCWDNNAEYKLIDAIIEIPEGISVKRVTAGSRLNGGALNYNLEDGKLRIVYFDANTNESLTFSGTSSPMEVFNITFSVDAAFASDVLVIKVSEMSLKLNSDSSDEDAKVQIGTNKAKGSVTVVDGTTFSAVKLYQGDGVDLIPANKKAVMVNITAMEGQKKLVYKDGTSEIEFKYSTELSVKTGVASYVALVSASTELEQFEKEDNFTISDDATAESITFGDINSDGVINAQDALAVVDMWLRKGANPTDTKILSANVNGDSRIDTYDALGIVEAFVQNDREYAIITKAMTVVD